MSRACDRCSKLKTQCNYEDPCARCTRLNLQCKRERPLRSRGRPRKQSSRVLYPSPLATTPSERAASPSLPSLATDHDPSCIDSPQPQTSSPATATVVPSARRPRPADSSSGFVNCLTLVENLPNLPIDALSAADLLHQLLSQSGELGLYGILPQNCHITHSFRESLGIELLYALLAISLELLPYNDGVDYENERALAKDTLRMSALALTPNLSWKSRQVKLCNSLCLLFLSYTYCLSSEFVEIAIRWNHLAWVIFNDQVRGRDCTSAEHEVERRTAMGLSFQDSILALLHHERPPASKTGSRCCSMPFIPDDLWHGGISREQFAMHQESTTTTNPQHSYFQLYCPLVQLLNYVLDNYAERNRNWELAIELAKDFFFDFPPQLLNFNALSLLYQAESMIWLHGIFLILYGDMDLLNLLLDPQFLQHTEFADLLDHSLLIAEVLPHLIRLDPYLTCLSPASVYFVVLSSVIQCLALRQYISLADGLENPAIVVPEKLDNSSRIHLKVLSLLHENVGRWEHPVVSEIYRLLLYCTSQALDRSSTNHSKISALVLMQYRWCGHGTGILALSNTAALSEWTFPVPPDEEIWSWNGELEVTLYAVVTRLCDPTMRMCQPGYFDLSLCDQKLPTRNNDNSDIRRLVLNGQKNQAIRFLIRRCHRSFVAIGQSGCPLLDEILPLASTFSSILTALLALAARLQTVVDSANIAVRAVDDNLTISDTESPSTDALNWHQVTISGIRSKLIRLQSGGTQEGDLKEVLAASLLLSMFGFPLQVNNWSLHVQGMIALIESTEPTIIDSLSVARFVRTCAAYNDISAFSLGRLEDSHLAWLKWNICPVGGSGKAYPHSQTPSFTPFEVTIGYPESLITIIAMMSAMFEEKRICARISTSLYGRLKHAFDNTMAESRLPVFNDPAVNNTLNGLSCVTMIEVLLESWIPPGAVNNLSPHLATSVLTAWECIRKAALIYLWRGGFEANPMIALTSTRSEISESYIRLLTYSIGSLVDHAESEGLTIANAMLWSLVVVGNECCMQPMLRQEVLRLLDRAQKHFSIAHFDHVSRLLQELWIRADNPVSEASPGMQGMLNLQGLSRQFDLCIPLF
ncbi:hypothetical protein EYB26_002485 [Talaromyces marneffei]|nr:uncharacterized protein EYB26_002485 [Talaromyces marneffei]QGA14829.1 hypothetical protein EYB26_002485 [Talaromyces marneffei]